MLARGLPLFEQHQFSPTHFSDSDFDKHFLSGYSIPDTELGSELSVQEGGRLAVTLEWNTFCLGHSKKDRTTVSVCEGK